MMKKLLLGTIVGGPSAYPTWLSITRTVELRELALAASRNQPGGHGSGRGQLRNPGHLGVCFGGTGDLPVTVVSAAAAARRLQHPRPGRSFAIRRHAPVGDGPLAASDGRLAELDVQGYRVPLVTGTSRDDLAGSLTYYFDKTHHVTHIHFRGTTGDPQDYRPGNVTVPLPAATDRRSEPGAVPGEVERQARVKCGFARARPACGSAPHELPDRTGDEAAVAAQVDARPGGGRFPRTLRLLVGRSRCVRASAASSFSMPASNWRIRSSRLARSAASVVGAMAGPSSDWVLARPRLDSPCAACRHPTEPAAYWTTTKFELGRFIGSGRCGSRGDGHALASGFASVNVGQFDFGLVETRMALTRSGGPSTGLPSTATITAPLGTPASAPANRARRIPPGALSSQASCFAAGSLR